MAGVEIGICVHPASHGEGWSRMNFQRIDVEDGKVPGRQLLFLKYAPDFRDDLAGRSQRWQRHIGRSNVIVISMS